jgi:hypothetical protein
MLAMSCRDRRVSRAAVSVYKKKNQELSVNACLFVFWAAFFFNARHSGAFTDGEGKGMKKIKKKTQNGVVKNEKDKRRLLCLTLLSFSFFNTPFFTRQEPPVVAALV